MWILECDGALLRQKRLWLKPGSTHLFGRTRLHSDTGNLDERSYVIENKSVSRKHLIIKVAPVIEGEGADVNARSKLMLTDDSRVGTYLDGEKFLKENRFLTKNEHEIKLASYEQIFRIKWQPVVLTFTLPEKRQARGHVLQKPQTELEPFDIKSILPYIPNRTTHVVAGKRNTAKGLQALLDGRYIVTDDYINAIIKVAVAPPNIEDPDVPLPSPLEEDFDESWPDALKFLPAEGKEPVPRPYKLFAPDPNRANVFAGFTFLFLDQNQYENLRDPIINGSGKAFLYEVQREVTTPSDVAQYVKSLAEEKGNYSFKEDDGDTAVVVVRFSGKKRTEDRDLKFMQDIDLTLFQRSIEQNEFLDAIVMNDASELKKKLEIESGPTPSSTADHEYRRFDTNAGADEMHPDEHPDSTNKITSTNSSNSKRHFRRPITESRFKGFDDFDESQIPMTTVEERQSPDAQDRGINKVNDGKSQSQTLFISDSPPATTKKRRSPPSEDSVDAEDAVEKLLPAAAAMKKRRLEGGIPASHHRSVRNSAEPAPEAAQAKDNQKKESKKGQDGDILSVARERREAEEVAARQDAESLERALDGMDIDTIKSLIKVEEMEVKRRGSQPPPLEAQRYDRWNEKWNGRKNFKKFRRRGEGEAMRGQRVIVGLEEVKKKDFGIGEEYWLESTTTQQQTTQSRSTQRDGRSSLQDDSRRTQDQGSSSRDRHHHPQQSAHGGDSVLIQATSGEDNQGHTQSTRQTRRMATAAEGGIGIQSRTGTGTGTGTSADANAGASIVVDSQLARSVPGKRSAPDASSRSERPPAKKPRIPLSRSRDDDDDGSDDGLRFRFRRKR